MRVALLLIVAGGATDFRKIFASITFQYKVKLDPKLTMPSRESRNHLKLVSGGQTGADRAALDAAKACNIEHGGWCPKGRYAEDGIIPETYQLCECNSPQAIIRTELNVRDSNATLIFSYGEPRGGSAATIEFAHQHNRPWLHVDLQGIENRQETEAKRIREWLSKCCSAKQTGNEQEPTRRESFVINVAGSRESNAPGIYNKVKTLLMQVLEN